MKKEIVNLGQGPVILKIKNDEIIIPAKGKTVLDLSEEDYKIVLEQVKTSLIKIK